MELDNITLREEATKLADLNIVPAERFIETPLLTKVAALYREAELTAEWLKQHGAQLRKLDPALHRQLEANTLILK